jgi:predicted nucleotidyltransferase
VALAAKQVLLDEIKAVLAADGSARLALLFGSRARDRAQPTADIDIAIDAPAGRLGVLAARISERLGMEVDLVSLESATIPFLEQLVAHSVVAYESERGRAAAWRSRVLSELETDRPWYRRMRDAWLERVAREGLGDGR